MVGVGLVLYRRLPKLKRYLAYCEGRCSTGPAMTSSCSTPWSPAKRQGAFAVRIGPTLVHHRWHTETIKAAIADPEVKTLAEVTPDETTNAATRLANAWAPAGRAPREAEGFTAGQPQYNFWLPLEGGADAVLKGMNQLWRRNIKKADKAGVIVREGTRDDCDFHRVYLETAERDNFTGRPLSYFETMWDALRGEVGGADEAVPGPPRGRPGRGDHLRPGRAPYLVFLRRLDQCQARGARLRTGSSGR